MSPDPRPESGNNAPLWLIALSLLTIAICMVFMVIGNRITPVTRAPEATRASANYQPQQSTAASTAHRRTFKPAPMADTPQPALDATAVTEANGSPAIETVAATIPLARGFGPGEPYPLSAAVPGNIQTLIKGRVTLVGTPPAERPIPYKVPCGNDKLPRTTHFFITGTNDGLADTLVYVSGGLDQLIPGVRPTTNYLAFTNCEIAPFVSAVFPDEHIVIRDLLGYTHALNVRVDKSSRVTSVPPNRGKDVSRDNLHGLFVPFICQTHPWEAAYVSVIPHPFFAVTDNAGEFSLTNLPPGDYVLAAVHRNPDKVDSLVQKVSVRAGTISQIDFAFAAPSK